jgi:hypothetical protein
MRHPVARLIALGGCVALAVACGKSDQAAKDSAAMAAAPAPAPPPPPAPLTLADIAGKWNLRTVPDSGDTTPTLSVLEGTADSASWKIKFANGLTVPAHVTASGDSIITDIGPYASVRRKGMQVTTHGVMRREGDRLVGTTVAHYKTTRPDSVLRLRTAGTRAP